MEQQRKDALFATLARVRKTARRPARSAASLDAQPLGLTAAPPKPWAHIQRRETTNLVVVHCSATPPTHDIGFDEINSWHLKRGWAGCGYHWILRRDGRIEAGRPEHLIGAHAKGVNQRSIGICLVGGMAEGGGDESNFTEAQLSALWPLIAGIEQRYPGITVDGHNHIPSGAAQSKPCPVIDIRPLALAQGFAVGHDANTTVLPPAVKADLDKPAGASSTNTGVGALTGLVGVLSWLSNIPPWMQVAAFAFAVLVLAYVVRRHMWRADQVRRAAQGKPVDTRKPSVMTRIWDAIGAAIGAVTSIGGQLK